MLRFRQIVLAGLVIVALTASTAGAATLSTPASTASAQTEGPQLTVYNQGLALVREARSLDLDSGLNTVQIRDVAARIDPTSVHFEDLTDPEGTAVLEQNFEYDLVGTGKLLQKYIDQEIRVVQKDGTTRTGTLLSGAGDIILQNEDGGVTVLRLDDIREFTFPSLPEGLITRPTLVWLVDTVQEGTHDIELSYLTRGVSWQANYVLVLSEDDTEAGLNGWVTLDNRSGATYQDAKLKLIAGDINLAPQQRAVPAPVYAVPDEAGRDSGFVEERAFFEYHLYEVQRPVTVKDNQTKQIEFVGGQGIPITKIYVYDGTAIRYYPGQGPIFEADYGIYGGNNKITVMLEFVNDEESGLGLPLPRGTVRIYKEDIDGSQQLLGEDAIDHTPRDETLKLTVGEAFDVVGERVQSDFRKLGRDVVEESFDITLRNHKDEDIEVRVIERLFRWSNWEIVSSNFDHTKLDSNTIEFKVPVSADGETTVSYKVRYSR